ncbi:hypothetical protein RD149_14395 [Gordonia westfalica]|uniref:Uncharacterized protein n=1 Tax=Gordonia westfalica TaxID=158898 RepID=A0ABU2GU16_9ACTN|nr:hypothetical protein [Gordonia westfalica]MDS1114956.1 hypothetical protein [Gordonia westfalica]
MTEKQTDPHTEEVDTAPKDAKPDVQSDPAEGEESGDWTGEGGATDEGPATEPEEKA